MQKSIIGDLFKLILVFGLIWFVFYLFPIIPDKDKLQLSIEKEEALGKLLVDQLTTNTPGFKPVNQPFADSILRIMELRLLDAIGQTDFEYNLLVVDNPVVNAFALPGGYILITTGLVEFTELPDELAAVIAHEMGHIENRHVVSRLAKEFGITILTSGDAFLLGEVSRTAISTAFDRKQERIADEFALNTLYKANLNPRALGVFFRRLKEQEGAFGKNMEMLSTHPHVNSRIKASFEFETSEDFEPVPFEMIWEDVKQLMVSTKQSEIETF